MSDSFMQYPKAFQAIESVPRYYQHRPLNLTVSSHSNEIAAMRSISKSPASVQVAALVWIRSFTDTAAGYLSLSSDPHFVFFPTCTLLFRPEQ